MIIGTDPTRLRTSFKRRASPPAGGRRYVARSCRATGTLNRPSFSWRAAPANQRETDEFFLKHASHPTRVIGKRFLHRLRVSLAAGRQVQK